MLGSGMVKLGNSIIKALKSKLNDKRIRPNNDTFKLRKTMKFRVAKDKLIILTQNYAKYLEGKYKYLTEAVEEGTKSDEFMEDYAQELAEITANGLEKQIKKVL